MYIACKLGISDYNLVNTTYTYFMELLKEYIYHFVNLLQCIATYDLNKNFK